jgi:hypothetical protein
MKATKLVPLSLLVAPALASAQPQQVSSGFDREVPSVKHGLELGVATGYTQGGGKLGGDMGNLEDISGAGYAVGLEAGYRIIPNLTIGAYGTFSQYQRGDDLADGTNVLGVTAGWKGLWLDADSGKTTSLQGLELARLQIGADYRITKDIAIAPVIGGSLSMFVSQDSPMTEDYTELDDKQVNFTAFAGLAGRFDLGGKR